MNKYVLTMAAAGLIAAAPAYYAFQAQAEEIPASTEAAAPAPAQEAAVAPAPAQEAAVAPAATEEATPEAKDATLNEPAAGEPAPKQPGNE